MKKKILVNLFVIILVITMFTAIPMIAYAEDDPVEPDEEPIEPDDSTNVGVLIIADNPNVGVTTIGDNANIDVSTSGDANVMINGEHIQQTVVNTTTKVYEGVGRTTVREEIDAKLFELIYPRLDLSETTFGQLLPLIGFPTEFYDKYGSSVNVIGVLIDNTDMIATLKEETQNNSNFIIINGEEIAAIKSNNEELAALILDNQNKLILLENRLESKSHELESFRITAYVGMAFLLLLFFTYVILKKRSSHLEKNQKSN
jgi:hypothetical protein